VFHLNERAKTDYAQVNKLAKASGALNLRTRCCVVLNRPEPRRRTHEHELLRGRCPTKGEISRCREYRVHFGKNSSAFNIGRLIRRATAFMIGMISPIFL